MKPDELLYVLNQLYGFDISRKCKTDHIVQAKKVFVQLCWKYGHRLCNYVPVINITHAACIHHQKSFHLIRPVDLHHYNTCIEYFNLPLQTYPSLFALRESNELNAILIKLKELNRQELIDFKRLKLDKYFKEKEFEEKYRLETNK
tara:strand:- start:5628 stop:6065 length:438 start_codon:yes stop_codon:yes gene_type:complete